MDSNFKRYWPFLAKQADDKGLSHSRFMTKCGFPKQSYTKYANGQGITAGTMIKLMEGLGLQIDQIEAKSHLKMTPTEKDELVTAKWVKENKQTLNYLRKHPEEMKRLLIKALREE